MFFKAKDLMTVGNIAGGLACVLVAMEGMASRTSAEAADYVLWAGFCMLVAWTFDAFDGVVARALGQVNRFGAEFDNVADLTSYSVAPSFILYLAYRRMVVLPGLEDLQGVQAVLAGVVALVPALFGCIRFARFNIRKLDVPGLWIGFPRPAAALYIIAMVNSHLFLASGTMQWIGIGLVVLVGFMNLSLVPFIGHHGRKFSWYLGTILHIVWATVAVSVIGGVFLKVVPANLAFDWVLVWLSFYLFIQWTDIPTATRREIARLTSDWNR